MPPTPTATKASATTVGNTARQSRANANRLGERSVMTDHPQEDLVLLPFRVSRDKILLAGSDPTFDVAPRPESQDNPYPSRNGFEFVSHVDEPLDALGRRFTATDGDDSRFRIEREPFGGWDDIESPSRTVEGERTRRHPAVEIGLKPRDPDPERLPFGNLELETEAP